MSVQESQVQQALQTVLDPATGKDLVGAKLVKNLRVEGSDVSLEVELGYPADSAVPALRQQVIDAVRAVPGVRNVSAHVGWKVIAHAVQRGVPLDRKSTRLNSSHT